MMKNVFIFIFTLLLITACGKAESSFETKFSHIDNTGLLQRIKTSLPEGVDISEISKIEKGLLISGVAEKSKQIKLFMDNISTHKIETAELQSVKSKNKQKIFKLAVINYSNKD